MMREDDRQFDLLVRSMMENAEVKAPRGVFRAVRGRLSSGDSRRPVFAFAGLALAAAAVVAAVILFRPDNSNLKTIEKAPVAEAFTQDQPFILDAETPSVTSAETATPAGRQAAALTAHGTSSQARLETKPKAVSRPDSVVDAPATEAASNESEVAVSQSVEASQEAVSNSSATKREASLPLYADASDARELRRPRARVSLTAGGLVSANNAGTGPVAMGSSPGIPIASNNSTILETSTSSYGVPVSLNLGLRFQLSDKWSIGTGVEYSLLTRTFSGKYAPSSSPAVDADFRHSMHYIGVPLDIYYTLYSPGALRIYVYAGGEAEYCFSNKYAIHTASGDETLRSPVSGLQFSVGGGLGVEFRVLPRFGIFLDPGLNYYFNCHQPKNVRTEKPLLLNIDAGVRFNF